MASEPAANTSSGLRNQSVDDSVKAIPEYARPRLVRALAQWAVPHRSPDQGRELLICQEPATPCVCHVCHVFW